MKEFNFKKLIIITSSIILFIISILLYSRFIGTSGIFIKEYKITYSKLSSDFYGFKIVHLSDIHYGRTIKKKELNNILKEVNLMKPDIVVLTGDLIDKDTKLTENNIKEIKSFLKKINANIGKYAIKGNHDYKFKKWENIIAGGEFNNLNDSYDLIYGASNNYIFITGVSTNLYGKKNINEKLENSFKFLEENEIKPNYSILIMHEPDFIDDIDSSKFNLVLAGHSHNGQIRLPLIGALYTPVKAKKYYDEFYKIKNTNLYISSGIGVSEINYRLFNRPSFNLYRLTNN